jgi:hypothetical protein
MKAKKKSKPTRPTPIGLGLAWIFNEAKTIDYKALTALLNCFPRSS